MKKSRKKIIINEVNVCTRGHFMFYTGSYASDASSHRLFVHSKTYFNKFSDLILAGLLGLSQILSDLILVDLLQPWLWIFEVQCWICNISERNDPIATKQRKRIYRLNNESQTQSSFFILGRDLDIAFQRQI